MKKNKITFLNALSSLILQIITIISGFIIPKIILNSFGSETNGLVASLNQLLNYVSLLEGGVTGVIMASLYKPLYNKDNKKISSIVNTSTHFYRNISYIFIIYTIILAILYPIFTKSSFSYIFVSSLTIILSINLFVQYCFSLSLKSLLNADKKVYIVSISQSILILLNIITSLIIIKIFPSIHVLKLANAIIFLFQPIIYSRFINKYFNIDKNIKDDKELLKSRWDGFSINIAYFIHANTDITLLTFFKNLSTVSIYGVYSLVTAGLRQLVSAISNGIAPSIGRLYAKGNIEELNKKFNVYEHIIFSLVFLLFTVGGLLITPFIMLYTKNIHDTNYYQPVFGYLLIIAEAIYMLRTPYVQLAYSANRFKDMKYHAYIEAILNILISILLINRLSIKGVAIGTLVAMTYRTLYQVIYLRKEILNRPIKLFIKKILIYTTYIGVGIIICKKIIVINNLSIINWLINATIYTLIISIIICLISFIHYKEETKYIISYLKIGGKKI